MMRTIFSLLLISLTITACGKKGPLIYPELLAPVAPSDIAISQTANSLRIKFTLPQKDLSGHRLKDLDGVNVFKRTLPSGQGPVCNACTADFELFRKVYVDLPDNSVQRFGNSILLVDSEVNTGKDYSYYAIAFNKDAIDGKTSKTVTAGVVDPPKPPLLKAVAEPTEIKLQFKFSAKAEAGFIGFNYYRAVKGEKFTIFPNNPVPVKENEFVDSGQVRGVVYKYVATTVVKGPAGNPIESLVSNEIEIKLADE